MGISEFLEDVVQSRLNPDADRNRSKLQREPVSPIVNISPGPSEEESSQQDTSASYKSPTLPRPTEPRSTRIQRPWEEGKPEPRPSLTVPFLNPPLPLYPPHAFYPMTHLHTPCYLPMPSYHYSMLLPYLHSVYNSYYTEIKNSRPRRRLEEEFSSPAVQKTSPLKASSLNRAQKSPGLKMKPMKQCSVESVSSPPKPVKKSSPPKLLEKSAQSPPPNPEISPNVPTARPSPDSPPENQSDKNSKKRLPFYTTTERTNSFKTGALDLLNNWYNTHAHTLPSAIEAGLLAEETGLSVRQIYLFFRNKQLKSLKCGPSSKID